MLSVGLSYVGYGSGPYALALRRLQVVCRVSGSTSLELVRFRRLRSKWLLRLLAGT